MDHIGDERRPKHKHPCANCTHRKEYHIGGDCVVCDCMVFVSADEQAKMVPMKDSIK